MSYGLQVTGNDSGGNFTVADTDLSMVNMVVTQVGRGHTFNLPGGIRPGDYIYVRYPSAVGGGDYTPYVTDGAPGQGQVQIDRPFVYSLNVAVDGTVEFVGAAWKWVNSNTVYGSRELYAYSGFEVEMDYFVARKASTIIDLNLHINDNYGLQLFTESGEIALDSRSFTSDKTFYIENYLPPEDNFGEINGQSSSLTYPDGHYVNLEWTRSVASFDRPVLGGENISGLYISNTSAYTIDGDVSTMGQGGEPTLQLWSSHNAIFAARLGEGFSSGGSPNQSDGEGVDGPDTEPDTITGSIDYSSGSTITEGDSISFDITTSESSNFHTRVFKVVGSSAQNDFVSVTSPFIGDSHTVTLNTYDTGSGSQTFDKTYSSGYIGTYTRGRISSYIGNSETSYSRDFTGNFIGNYSNTATYQTDFSANYTRTRSETLSYSRTFTGNNSYTGNYLANQTFYEGGDVVYLPINFSSFYTRVRTSAFAGQYTRNSSNSLSYVGNYARTSTRTRYSSYAGTYSRNRVSSYVRNRGVNSTRTDSYTGYYSRSFVGNYSRTVGYSRTTQQNFVGEYVGQLDYIRYSTVNYLGNYARNVASTNTFSRSFTNTTPYARNFAGTYTRTVAGAPYSRWFNYSRSFVGDYANTNSYSRDFVGNYVGNYTRTVSYSRTVSAYHYQVNPKYYWLEAPESQGAGEGGLTKQIDVYWDGARVATTVVPTFSSISYISSGSTVYHKGVLSNTIGSSTYYSVGPSSSTTAPSGSTSSYSRTVPYSRTSTRTLSMSYAPGGTYSRTRVDTYSRLISYTGTNTLYYIGNYARNYVSGAVRTESYVGDFVSQVAYTRSRPAYFTGNFTGLAQEVIGGEPTPIISTRTRVSSYSGTYTRNVSYSRTRIMAYAGAYSRTLYYSASYTGNYARNIVDSYGGTYSRSYLGNYTNTYSRTSVQGVTYTGNYAGTVTKSFTGNYTRFTTSTYSRTRISTVTRNSSYSATVSFVGDYVGNYIGNFTGVNERTQDSTRTRTSSYTRSAGTGYERTIVSSFTGNYVGNYTSTSTRSPSNTSEIGWQGERFVIELRRGSDSTSMAAPRGDSNVEVLDSKEFTLLDNDSGLFVSMSPQVVHHTATQHDVVFDFYTEGSSVVPARLYRGGSIIVNSFNLSSNQRNTLTVNEVPPAGSTYTYTLQVYNGVDWILGTYYQVTKTSPDDTDTSSSDSDSPGNEVPNTQPPGNIEN